LRDSCAAYVLGDLDLVRPLRSAGIPVVAIVGAESSTRYSRTVRAVLRHPGNEHGAELLDVVERHAQAEPAPPVLYYQDDADLLLVSRNRERLARSFRFVVAAAELVEDLVDKRRFGLLAARLALPVPRAVAVATDGSAPLPALEFPVLLKPLSRDMGWESATDRAKAVLVSNAREMAALLGRVAARHSHVLAQEHIPGGEERIESYHVYVDDGGEIVAEFTGRKLRTLPAAYGHTTALVVTNAHDVAELGRHVIGLLRLVGVAKLDFKRGPDGRLHLLEVNPRFNLWHFAGARAGVNLPALVWADLTGTRRPQSAVARAGVTWCRPWTDLLAARNAGIPLLRWARWVARCDALAVAAWNDPVPLLRGEVWQRVLWRLGRPTADASTPAPG